MDEPGIEPGAYCLQSRRDTTTPYTQYKISRHLIDLNLKQSNQFLFHFNFNYLYLNLIII